MHACVHTYIHTWIDKWIARWTGKDVEFLAHATMCFWYSTHKCTYKLGCVCIYIYTHTYVHTYIHTCIYTYQSIV